MTVHELSRTDARRMAVRAQLLDSARLAGLAGLAKVPWKSTGWTNDRNITPGPSGQPHTGDRKSRFPDFACNFQVEERLV